MKVTVYPTYSWRNPLHWPLWAKLALSTSIILIAIVIGVAVGVTQAHKANAYPDYSYLQYSLQDAYQGENFFDNFDYFTEPDPTYGFVRYVSADTASSSKYNLTYASKYASVLKVDTTERNASQGRMSVRLSSKRTYDSGLFVFDITHSPYGCSLWPSIWLVDTSHWPVYGEIDVLEAVNTGNTGNQMTLHTNQGCEMKVKRNATGRVLTTNCLNSTGDNAGCGVKGQEASYGKAFNDAGGGIYAMELRAAGIRVWMFPRSAIPADLAPLATGGAANTSPDPASWPTPLADFPSTKCDVSTHFRNQSIIANIDLCGSWAGSDRVYSQQYGCPGKCEDYVATNASAFDTAYWEWKGWWVFGAPGA